MSWSLITQDDENILHRVFIYSDCKLENVDQCSGRPRFNPRSSHTKDSKMVLDAFLLNTQYNKVRIKGKVRAIQGKE